MKQFALELLVALLLAFLIGCGGGSQDRVSFSGNQTYDSGIDYEDRESPSSRDRVLARVGDDVITDGELRERILDRYHGPRALNGLVRESLFLSEAGNLDIRIDPEEIAALVEQELTQILGATFEERRVAKLRLEQQGLLESDLRREIALEVGPALLIQKVVSAHRQIDEEEILDLWRATWKEPRRLIEHIVFPRGDADQEELTSIEQWAQQTAEALRRGSSLENAVQKPVGLRSSFTPRIGGGWVRESDLAASPLFFEVFQIEVGKVLGPVNEENYGWHLFRVVETRPTRSYSEVRAELLLELRERPATDSEILEVEQRIRNRVPVYIESNSFSSDRERP